MTRSESLPPVVAGLALLLALAATGCAGAAPRVPPPGARTTVLSLREVDCEGCAKDMVDRLAGRPGLHEARFDKRRVELTLVHDPGFDLEAVTRLAREEGIVAEVGAGRGAYLRGPEFPPGADVRVVSREGEDVPDLAALAVAGKVTVVDFYAEWCGPCRDVDAHMVELLAKRGDVAYRRINVVDWDSPVAQRHLRKVPALPYLVVYGRDGAEVARISGLDLAALDAAIARGAR